MHLLLSFRSVVFHAILTIALLACGGSVLRAQTMTNAGFESGTGGWNTCPLEINPASVYGGVGSNLVAEVDGDNDPNSTADDKLLCQPISGFTVGAVYMLGFDAARRQGGPTPTTVSVNVHMDNVLLGVVTRTGTWSLLREELQFTATATAHNLRITPNFTVSYGMLFDNFAITLVSGLPVELLRFDARPEGDAVRLEWATASETNSDHFQVERSPDALTWTPIASVPAAGHSLTELNYSVYDTKPLAGASYYRLNQVDRDGTENISDTRAVSRTGGTSALALWPNPATDVAEVWVGDGNTDVQLLNQLGQVMPVPMERTGATLRLQLAALPSGPYLVRMAGGSAAVAHLLKQ